MLGKYINLNCLYTTEYIISSDLQTKLFKAQEEIYCGNNNNNKFEVKNNPIGVYIINFIILNKNNKTLIYNYVYYRSYFCENLVVYFVLRNYFIKINNLKIKVN